MLTLEVPGGYKDVLLHCCCAPCSGAVLECMLHNGLRPVVFFSNSNIVPRAEYDLRREELERYCHKLGLTTVDDDYDHRAWLDTVLADKALAEAPERGPRCLNCFKFRLLRAARYAADHNLPVLTTTLASSRWKSLEQVDEAGRWACAQVAAHQPPGGAQAPLWWPQNWRKGGLQPRRSEIIQEQQFYNQNFCGCEFSKRNDPD